MPRQRGYRVPPPAFSPVARLCSFRQPAADEAEPPASLGLLAKASAFDQFHQEASETGQKQERE